MERIVSYRGKRIEDMSKKELREVIDYMANELAGWPNREERFQKMVDDFCDVCLYKAHEGTITRLLRKLRLI